MPGKSRSRQKRIEAAKKMKITQRVPAVSPVSPGTNTVSTPVSSSAPAATLVKPSPSPVQRASPSLIQPSYVGAELLRIGIVGVIITVLLVAAWVYLK